MIIGSERAPLPSMLVANMVTAMSVERGHELDEDALNTCLQVPPKQDDTERVTLSQVILETASE